MGLRNTKQASSRTDHVNVKLQYIGLFSKISSFVKPCYYKKGCVVIIEQIKSKVLRLILLYLLFILKNTHTYTYTHIHIHTVYTYIYTHHDLFVSV